MLVSDRYLKQLKKIRRTAAEKPEGRVVAEVREAFFTALGPQPEGLKHDIFNRYVQAYYDRPGSGRGGFLDAAEGLCRVVDLFHRDYADADQEPARAEQDLSDEELDFLRVTVDAYAAEIDIDVVTDIMKLLIARKRIH